MSLRDVNRFPRAVTTVRVLTIRTDNHPFRWPSAGSRSSAPRSVGQGGFGVHGTIRSGMGRSWPGAMNPDSSLVRRAINCLHAQQSMVQLTARC